MSSSAHPSALGRYRITGELGSGAMGSVFLARDERLGRDVAIKAMRPVPGHAATLLERFFNEARAIAGLAHPNIIRIFDVDEDGGVPFMVMEVARGGSLKKHLERGPLSVDLVRSLGIQLALALAAAHERGILHRDVKPANVLEAEPGVWKLADFGVAHVPEVRLTLTGQFLGSPAYAPPEALEGGEFGPASDVYGLAATLYEAVTGSSPHANRGHETRIVDGDLETSAHAAAIDPLVPAAIRAGIIRGLARRPQYRPTASELAAMFASSDAAHAAVPPVEETPLPLAVHASPVLRPALEAPAGLLRRHRRLGAAAGVVCLVTYLIVASTRSGRTVSPAATSATSSGERPSPNLASPALHDDDYDRRWQRINSSVNSRDWHDADKELRKLLARHPDDPRGRAVLAEVRRAMSASRHFDRDRDRRVDEDHDDDRDDDIDEDVDEDD